MPNPGLRRLFVARDPQQFADLRRQVNKQSSFACSELSLSTLSRIERGGRAIERTARTAHQLVAPQVAFDQVFKLAPEQERRKLEWKDVNRSAGSIGRMIFKDFRPHFIITFAGPPALFTSLAMIRALSRDEFLAMTVYTALYRKKKHSIVAPMPGFRIISSHRFVVQVPLALEKIKNRASKRICIVDDTVTTGSVGEKLKEHLVNIGYSRKNIRYVTCVCNYETYQNPITRPYYATYKMKGKYKLPWGDPL